jgi:acyl-CoA hydrolase
MEERTSPGEIFYGSRILQIIDKVALNVAKSHAEMACTLDRIDFVKFFSPAKKGDVLICSASVNRVWQYDMEIGVKVLAEDLRILEQKDILYAYFTFSALDDMGNKSLIPYLILENKIQKKRYLDAGIRRGLHLKNSFKHL